MPLPAPADRIDAEEATIGRTLPVGLRQRLAQSNGGEASIGNEFWTLFSVWDPTNRRTATKSAGHIARETAALFEALGERLPRGAVALGENGNGDYLLLLSDSTTAIWRHETSTLEEVTVEWAPNQPLPDRLGLRATKELVKGPLYQMKRGEVAAVVVDVPGTGLYVQFARTGSSIVGEAVGERNMSKSHSHRIGPRLQERLPNLGWTAPQDAAADGGNWTQRWSVSAWDPDAAATLVVRTLHEAYGLEPMAIRAYSAV